MIPKESYGFNTFVANRIGEIQEKTDKKEWMWVPGKLNIADWTTRGKSPTELDQGQYNERYTVRYTVLDWT